MPTRSSFHRAPSFLLAATLAASCGSEGGGAGDADAGHVADDGASSLDGAVDDSAPTDDDGASTLDVALDASSSTGDADAGPDANDGASARDGSSGGSTGLTTPWPNVYFVVDSPHMIQDADLRPGQSNIEGSFFVIKHVNGGVTTFDGFATINAQLFRWSGTSLTNMGHPVAAAAAPPGRTGPSAWPYCPASAAAVRSLYEGHPTAWHAHPYDMGLWVRYGENNNGVYRGWAHSETFSCYAGDNTTYASIQFVRSMDGGHTWLPDPDHEQPGPSMFPQDNIPPTFQAINGLREASVVRTDDFYYLFFVNQNVHDAVHDSFLSVARSTRADGGLPGSWLKFDGSGWSGMFVHPGQYYPVRSAGPATSHPFSPGYASSYQRVLLVGDVHGVPSISWSDRSAAGQADPRTFQRHSTPLIPVENVASTARDGAYNFSVVGPDGENRFAGNTFYIYYALERGPQASMSENERSLVVHPVTIHTDVSVHGATNRIMLRQWYDSATHDHWATTTMPTRAYYQSSGTAPPEVGDLGYLKTADDRRAPLHRLLDCRNQSSGRHTVRSDAPCLASEDEIRVLGYIYVNSMAGTTALYQCHTPTGDSFLGHPSQCVDPAARTLIGYTIN